MLKRKDVLSLHYYNYAQPFFGSENGKRFRIAREPMVHYQWGDKELLEKTPILLVTIWKEPFCYEKTPQEKRVQQEFEFSEEGLCEAIEWINSYKIKGE